MLARAVTTISLLTTPIAHADVNARVVLGNTQVPEAVLERALLSCQGERLACIEGGWLDGFRLALAARDEGLEASARFARVRRNLLLEELYDALGRTVEAPSEGDLRASYEKDKAEYVRPEAIRVFRMLFSTEAAGRAVLEQLPEVVTLKDWRARCREHSVDRATHARGGDLGFVGPDGGTDIPEVRADPGLYRAAAPLKDGQILRELVPEGNKFALLWRRGSRAAQEQTFEQVRSELSLRLDESRRYEKLRELITSLRSKELHDFSPNKLALYQEAQKSSHAQGSHAQDTPKL